MTKFNLLELHNSNIDKKPRMWIHINGMGITNVIDLLINDICRTNYTSKHQLSIKISRILNCNSHTIGKRFYHCKGYEWYPIHLVNTLLDLWKETGKSDYDVKNMLEMINNRIQFLRTGRSYIHKAVKEVSPSIAKLCGAIIADGHITKERNSKIYIIDNYPKSIKKCAKWFEDIFGFPQQIKKSKKFDAWYLKINSKIAARIFNIFFEIPVGKKSKIVKEPHCIKESKYRLDFANGVLLMDGCIETDNIISFGTVSKKLAEDIFEILEQNNFSVKLSYKPFNKIFMVKTNILNKRESKKWIEFFEKDTEKWQKLYEINYGFNKKPKTFEEAFNSFNGYCGNSNKINFKEVILTIKELENVNKKILATKLNIGISTLHKYLWLLEKAKIIKVTRTYQGSHIDNEYFYNSNIKEWRVPSVN